MSSILTGSTSIGRDYLAIDWGTTNRRIHRITDGAVARSVRDGRGVTALAPGTHADELRALRAEHGDLPVLAAGMIGSSIGWREARYVPAPADGDTLAAHLLWIDERTAIVPGVAMTGPRADVMRGEEVQLLGAVGAGLAPPDALLVQPGTHSKWARMEAGRIAAFTTAMTGELFALLRAHGLLARQLGAAVTPGDAFREGVEDGKARDLAASLFGIRAAALLGRRDDGDAASYASGLLIGAEVCARLADAADRAVFILADAVLGPLYAAAIAANGGTSHLVDSDTAFVAGMIAIGART